MEKKKRFKHPSREEQTTDLTLLDERDKELGITQVEAPDIVTVIFPISDEVVE